MDLNIIETTMTVGPKKGQTLYGVKAVSTPNIQSATMLSNVKSASTFSEADSKAIIREMVEVMIDAVCDGYAVDLGELGTLRPTLSAKAVDSAQECTARTIKSKGLRYSARADFNAAAKQISLHVIGATAPKSTAPQGNGTNPGGTNPGGTTGGSTGGNNTGDGDED